MSVKNIPYLPAFAVLSLFTPGLLKPAAAADAPIIRTGNFELGGFSGVSFVPGSAVKGNFGGNLAYALNRWFMPYAELSYFPRNQVDVQVSGIPGATASFNTSALDYSAGVHFRVPLPKTRFIPYGILGFGGFRYSGTTSQSTVTIPDQLNFGKTVTLPLGLNTVGATDPAISYGGGVRYYANERFGLRVEAKGYQPIKSDLTHVFSRVTLGVFYQFR